MSLWIKLRLHDRTIGHPCAPAGVIAVLAGMSIVLLVSGFAGIASDALDFTPLTIQLAVGASMLALATGPSCLAWLMILFRRQTAVKRKADEATSNDIPASRKRAADQDLRWMVTSIVALVGAVAALGSPELFRGVEWIKSVVQPQFLWTRLVLASFEGACLFAAILVPLALLGLLVRCAHQVSFPDGRWHVATGGWLLFGVGLGFGIAGILGRVGVDSVVIMRIASAPLLAIAPLAVAQVSRRGVEPIKACVAGLGEPEYGQRWPTILRAAIVLLFAAGVCSGATWVHVACTLRMEGGTPFQACAALMLAAAFGILFAHRRAKDANELIGSFGQSAVLAGIVLAGMVALFNLVLRQCDAPFVESHGFELLWLVCAGVPSVCIAHAIGLGSISVLRRYSFRGVQGATLLWLKFAVTGVVLLVVAPQLLRGLGSFATLTATALCMVGTGGILIIHGPGTRTGLYQARLTGVFASVLLMMWTMPHLGQGWLSDRQHPREVLVESWWMSYYLDASGQPRAIHANKAPARFAAGRDEPRAIRNRDRHRHARVGVLDLSGAVLNLLPTEIAAQADVYSFDVTLRDRIAAGPTDDGTIRSWAELRAGADVYDLLVISVSELPPGAVQKATLRSFIDSATSRLSADGVLVLRVPVDSADQANRVGDLARLWAGGSRYCGVQRSPRTSDRMATLFVGQGANAELNVNDWSAGPLSSPLAIREGVGDGDTLSMGTTVGAQPTAPALAAAP